jgi:hypothetical protein
MKTDNFKIFHNYTGGLPIGELPDAVTHKSFLDSHLFDIVEPRHPCAGGLTIEDVQRRLALLVHYVNVRHSGSSLTIK